MKAKELMIGDWVLCDRNAQSDYEFDNVDYQPYQIANGEDIDYAFEQNMIGDADVYQPIPLTKEILEKNFDKKTMYGVFDDYFDFEIREFSDSIYIVNYHSCEMPVPDTQIGGICFVHELQHALRLCGIEKEINL